VTPVFESLRRRINTLAPRKKRKVKGVDSLRALFPEATDLDLRRISEVTQFTMTSPKRLRALRCATQYVLARRVPGDFAEAGVWRGGSTMLMAATALHAGDRSRGVWLYDTFEGMPMPQAVDVAVATGEAAAGRFQATKAGADSSAWCDAPLDEVKANMARIGYPSEAVRYIVGKTQQTLPTAANRPAQLALLRLDTDWYESTKAELENLFDRLSPGGVLIIDDYGHWAGCMRAVDAFFAEREPKYLFNRIDTIGRMMVKV
jgi:predicted O-methyltransferase YrrM